MSKRTTTESSSTRFVATSDAAGCTWLATGATADDAKRALVKAYRAYMKSAGAESPMGPRFTTADYVEWYGVWVYDLAAGPAFCDGESVR